MSALALSFEGFTAAAKSARIAIVGPNGFYVEGTRFNHRRLNRFLGKEIRYFLDELEGIGLHAVCFDVTGRYLCNAIAKRRYNDWCAVFVRAMDFDQRALRKLRAYPLEKGKWDERLNSWPKRLANVLLSVMMEPPRDALPWYGEERRAA